MDSWSSYFEEKLTTGKDYYLYSSFKKGQTNFSVFKAIDISNETIIEVGIIDDDLITLQFVNQRTKGFSEHQKNLYFYKYDFYKDKTYGGPGLEFNEINSAHFDKFLREGLMGKEIQYFQNNKLIKSEVFQFYGINENCSDSIVINFKPISLIDKVRAFFLKEPEVYDKREILLKDVFGGLGQRR
jgi:hypothetical protein